MTAWLPAPQEVIYQMICHGDGFFEKANLVCIPPNGGVILKQGTFFPVKLTSVSVKMFPKHKCIMLIGTTCCHLQRPLTKVKLFQQAIPVDVGNMLHYSKRWLGMWVRKVM